ncbi:thioredoxin domain-containing protein [Clostridium polynesiense]|uniref:thioredoxin domain-containing protein n=1 Tax=Clostridium polynesiense TaxID=1325933 RepID=UPI000693E644|nr:thioredoxin domain-containing protein [Clostridium polynesiense]
MSDRTPKNGVNRLIHEKSPYLLQHAYNPIQWYPWCDEAFEKAKLEDKPIFLSVGYSTCHWCHVMEKESFEDHEVADVLNKNYISIKVDREERPDIDELYMKFCIAMSGSGGWPMTIVMTPEGKPFFAATYIPKEEGYGIKGLIQLLNELTDYWRHQRDSVKVISENIYLEVLKNKESKSNKISEKSLENAVDDIREYFDKEYGGFGRKPKFPTPHVIIFLLKYYSVNKSEQSLEMAETTLVNMYKGGIFDHIGYGFSRYSVDNKWLIPHFEKMLYDNALLLYAYSEAFYLTKKDIYKKAAYSIYQYISRELTSNEGGFFCGEDADSEGVEGKFYSFTPEDIISVLGEREGNLYCSVYGITTEGNFEGKNIPNLINKDIKDIERIIADTDELRIKLFQYREKRIHPFKDDKILLSWNGLTIAALAHAADIFTDVNMENAAIKGFEFIENNLIEEGRLKRRYRAGETAIDGFLEDYAFYVFSLLELYDLTKENKFINKAEEYIESMIELFLDHKEQGFFTAGRDSAKLIINTKETYDGAIPSGNSAALYVIIRFNKINKKYDALINSLIKCYSGDIDEYPLGHTMYLWAMLLNSN